MKAGLSWRILTSGTKGQRGTNLYSKAYERGDRKFRREMGIGEDDEPRLVTEHEEIFDELVIDPWLHLEQMSDRSWFLIVGGYRLYIHIPAKGDAQVTYEGKPLEDYGMERDL